MCVSTVLYKSGVSVSNLYLYTGFRHGLTLVAFPDSLYRGFRHGP